MEDWPIPIPIKSAYLFPWVKTNVVFLYYCRMKNSELMNANSINDDRIGE